MLILSKIRNKRNIFYYLTTYLYRWKEKYIVFFEVISL